MLITFTRIFDIFKYKEYNMNSIRSYIRQVLSEAGDAEQSINLERQVGDTLKIVPGTFTGTDPAAENCTIQLQVF